LSTCSRDQCQARARWIPVLCLHPRRAGKGPPTRVRFRRVGYCEAHRSETTLDSLLSAEGAARLSKHLREAGLPEPDPRLTELSWERARPADVQRLARKRDLTPAKTTDDPDEGIAF